MSLSILGRVVDPDLLFLPWHLPLEQWPPQNVVALPRGISRHTVRFTRVGDAVYAVKEIAHGLAEHEYRQLGELNKLGIPSVQPVAVVSGRTSSAGEPLESVLVTRHLSFSLPYRAVFSGILQEDTSARLVDALAVLLTRLHLIGFVWKDCSLSNTLFRRDAGAFAAYLVDAETGELHASVSDGLRWYDIDTACLNLTGELFDLQAAGKLQPGIDPVETATALRTRYERLWSVLTEPLVMRADARHELADRIRELNELGFDIAEMQVESLVDRAQVQVRAKVVEAGHHARRLMRLTGLEVQENQARRLLNDIDVYRAELPADDPVAQDEQLCARRWVAEVFEPVVTGVPPALRGKLEPAEVYHEVLEHRWYLSERLGRDIGMPGALASYIDYVLAGKPDEQAVLGSLHGSDNDETQEIRLVLPPPLP